MQKLVNRYVWLTVGTLYLPVAVKCAMMWDSGRGAAALGERLPFYLMLPVLATLGIALVNYLENKILVDPDGAPQLRRVLILTLALFLYIHCVMLLAPLTQWTVRNLPKLIFVGIGVFFVLLGVLMPKLKRNRVAGVRYTWTLLDPEVWQESNRVGGRYTVAMGAALLISTFIPQNRPMIFSTFELWAFITYVVALTLHSRLIALRKNPPRQQ